MLKYYRVCVEGEGGSEGESMERGLGGEERREFGGLRQDLGVVLLPGRLGCLGWRPERVAHLATVQRLRCASVAQCLNARCINARARGSCRKRAVSHLVVRKLRLYLLDRHHSLRVRSPANGRNTHVPHVRFGTQRERESERAT